MQNLIEISQLYKEFPIRKGLFNKKIGAVHALNNINLNILKGETLGLVGESGCGKSTLGRCILGLTDITSGKITYNGMELNQNAFKKQKELRQKLQIIFQNPYSSLNPRMKIGEILKEPIYIHNILPKDKIQDRVLELLQLTGLSPAAANKYPHEFSGGQRQRIAIARALSLNPKFIVADEPVSALDVSIQAQIINLLQDLKTDFGLTYLFISHDLNVVKHISDRVAVMYLGEIVELSSCAELFTTPLHPYTKALMNSVPSINQGKMTLKLLLKGDIPSPTNLPTGCKFHTRCGYVQEVCQVKEPEFTEVQKGHFVRCNLLS